MNRLRSLLVAAIAILLTPSSSVADDGSTTGWSEIITAAELDAEAQRTLAELHKIVRDDASFAKTQRQIAPHAAALACLAYIAQHHSKDIAWRAHAVTIQQKAIAKD